MTTPEQKIVYSYELNGNYNGDYEAPFSELGNENGIDIITTTFPNKCVLRDDLYYPSQLYGLLFDDSKFYGGPSPDGPCNNPHCSGDTTEPPPQEEECCDCERSKVVVNIVNPESDVEVNIS